MVYLTPQLESDVAERVSAKLLRPQHELQLEHDVGSVGDFDEHSGRQRDQKLLPKALSGVEEPGEAEPAEDATRKVSSDRKSNPFRTQKPFRSRL